MQEKLREIYDMLISHKKKIGAIIFIIILYLLGFLYRYELETYATFPGVHINTLEYTKSYSEKIKLEFEDINITLENGDNLNGLFIDNQSETTVYYFHGNGGDLTFFYPTLQYISDLGYNVMAYDYPGYGKSDGFSYAVDVQKYSDIFFNYIQEEKGVSEKNTIVWGYSIGTGVSLEWAKNRDIQSVVLFAAYLSRYELSRSHYIFAIQKLFFLPNSFESDKNITDIEAPVFLIHGNRDSIVPFHQGKKLFLSSDKENRYFLENDTGDHFDFLDRGVVRSYVEDFLAFSKLSQTYNFIAEIDEQEWLSYNDVTLLDIDKDSSITKFVSPDVSFTDVKYIPEGMKKLDRTYIVDTKGDAQMREEAKLQFENMAEKFYAEFNEKIVVVSSYRSYSYQAGIKARGCPDNLCAKAGHSEHQSGLSVDVWSASTNAYWISNTRLSKFYSWFSEHAHKYGFHNTYQKGREVDGYEIEPWHWRYLGLPLAQYLKDNDMTLAEYYQQRKKEG